MTSHPVYYILIKNFFILLFLGENKQNDDGLQSNIAQPEGSELSKCQPKCSPEFCLKNPRSMCSAV